MNLVFLLAAFTALLFLFITFVKWPAFTFMLGLALYFNIGGYLGQYIFGFPGYFTFLDSGLIIATFAGVRSATIETKKFSPAFRSLLKILFFFSLYQILVTIIFKLNINSPYHILRYLFVHKWRIFGVYFAIPTYYLVQNHSKAIVKIIMNVTLIILGLYFISLLTPLNLIKIVKFSRSFVTGATRISIVNYGYIYMSVLFGAIVYLLKLKIAIRSKLFIASLGMVATVLMTLTRGTTIMMMGSIFIAGYLLIRYFDVKISKTMTRSLLIFSVALIVLNFIFPQFSSKLYKTYQLTFLEATGQIKEGSTQSRSEFEVVKMGPLFLKHFWTGTGYLKEYFGSYGTDEELGLADIPILGNLAIYGVIGFLLYLVRYFIINKAIKKLLLLHKKISILSILSPFEIVLLLWAIVTFYTSIFFTFLNFSKDLVYGGINVGFMIGTLYGLANKYVSNIEMLEFDE